MDRPTLSLACILKNELKNLSQLLGSVAGCFDEVHLTDTGSTDGSIEQIQGWIATGSNPSGARLHLHHFPWCDDFAAARNASFEPVKTDYVMWMDLDDVLSDREKFIYWRDKVMQIADFWAATYHYASDGLGNPACSFARERVFRVDLGFRWKYFIHEGVLPISPIKGDLVLQYATPWSIIHKRDEEDVRRDRSRNLVIFEKRKSELDARMRYYYGKELYENGKPFEGLTELLKIIPEPELEHHDRIMGIQYAALCAMQLNQFERAIALAHQGLQLAPDRAEFYVTIADSYGRMNKLLEATPFYRAATQCRFTGDAPMQGAIFQHGHYYKHYPLNQLARINHALGNTPQAEIFVQEALKHGAHPETLGILNDIEQLKAKAGIVISTPAVKTDEIVITCPSAAFYEWDEGIYREKGIGGSETAVVEMAHHLARQTGRKIKVFNHRSEAKSFDNVEYLPNQEAPKYLRETTPALHIAWRHNAKLSDAKTFLWCHDLMCQGVEQSQNYEKILALSEFHSGFLQSLFSVPKDKVIVTRNGIDPDRWVDLKPDKVKNKVIWSSSPDRGLGHALMVMDLVVSKLPDATLHVFYGVENMRKNGKNAEADKLLGMMLERSYVKYYGNVPQSQLTEEFLSSCAWLYPTNFLETFCITALESWASCCYPVVRRWGALPDTLAAAEKSGAACLLKADCIEYQAYAKQLLLTLSEERWQKMGAFDFEHHSWGTIANEWLGFLGL